MRQQVNVKVAKESKLDGPPVYSLACMRQQINVLKHLANPAYDSRSVFVLICVGASVVRRQLTVPHTTAALACLHRSVALHNNEGTTV
jgi:hypothetical protein